MLKKIIFSLILFVSPLFANDALACYRVVFYANGGDSGSLTTAYYNPTPKLWYSDSTCGTSVAASEFLPTRRGYQLRGFWGTQLADVSANDATTGLVVSNEGVVTQNIPKMGATLYAAWAQDCENNCSLTIGEDGSVTYSQLSNPDCFMVTLNANNGAFSGNYNDNKLYSMGGHWYTDSMCTKEYTTTTELNPSRDGYVFRGFYNSILPDISETTTAANTSSDLCIANDGAATEYCRITKDITIYAAWAQDCSVVTNGTCDVITGTDGGVDYNTICNTGYEPQQDQNTATPSCTKGLECYRITFEYNGGSLMQSQPSLYKQEGSTGFFSDANCTTTMTPPVPNLILPTRTGYELRGFYNTDLADVSENASNGDLYATKAGVLTPFAISWTITDGNSTLYAAWAQDCSEVTNGTCDLEIDGGTGAATYNTSCNSGYVLSDGDSANPKCTSGFWNGGGGGSCGDVVNIYFWGLNDNGTLENLTPSAQPTFTNSSKQWKTSGGAVVTTFKSLGVSVPTIESSITVNGTTYAQGIKPYRAQWVGGTPTGTDGMVAETTVCPSNMNASRDIALDGSLPDITDAIKNYATEANYIILYAANCIDPTGANSNSTCKLTVADGGASYANTCLAGWGGGNFWNSNQFCQSYTIHDMEQGACEL